MKSSVNAEIPDEIVQPARVEAVSVLVEFVSAHARERTFEDERIRGIGLAVEEAVNNIIRYACCGQEGEISISCSTHDSGALCINIADTGAPFNMLLASTFPEVQDLVDGGAIPPTGMMKKYIKNIEYIRGRNRNTLIFLVSPTLLTRR
jgi:anti-sigma regulatory factor (Ser/Thr protein kinase)